MSKKFLGLLVLVVAVMSFLFWHQHAAAQPCVSSPGTCYSRAAGHGYFTNIDFWNAATAIDRGPVFYGPGGSGLTTASNLGSFLGLINGALTANLASVCTINPATYAPVGGESLACNNMKHDAIGAAFIVDVMLDKNGSDFGTVDAGVNYAKNAANYAAWVALVSGYDANGWVQWTKAITITNDGVNRLDSYGDDLPRAAGTNGARDTLFEFHDWAPGLSEDFIVFRNPNTGEEVDITKWCGNFALNVITLPPPPPPVAGPGVCSPASSPGSPHDYGTYATGSTFTIRLIIQNTDLSKDWKALGYKFVVSEPGGGLGFATNPSYGTYTYAVLNGVQSAYIDFTFDTTANPVPPLPTPKNFTFFMDTDGNGVATAADIPSPTCQGFVTVGVAGLPGATLNMQMNGIDSSNSPFGYSNGSPLKLTWNSTNVLAGSCAATGTWAGPRADNSSTLVPPYEDRSAPPWNEGALPGPYTLTYTLTCTRTDNGLTITKSLQVNIAPLGVPPTSNKPYFKVTNGDVVAGPGFYDASASPTCPQTATAPLAGFSSGTPLYAGAGSQLAAFDLGTVTGFSTGLGLGIGKPKYLTFANISGSGVGAPASEYGGGFGFLDCMTDYYGLPVGLSGWSGAYTTGRYQAAGNTTLAGSTIASGQHVAIYVLDQDVYIGGDIKFGGMPWATSAAIPNFYLIVKGGNIYIDSSVKQLDGVYIAQPHAGAKGYIYTCATGGAFAPPSTADMADSTKCGANTLTVNGSFMAQRIKLLRTGGDISGAPAEIFNYSPDVWLGAPATPNVPGPTMYDSITTLPPVL